MPFNLAKFNPSINLFPNQPQRQQSIPMPSTIPQPIPTMPDMNLGFRNQMAPNQMNQSPALEQYQNYLSQQPMREDFAPSKWRRLGAAISGIGAGLGNPGEGFQTSSRIINQPYHNALQDWGLRGEGLQNAANIEQKNQANENTQWRNFATAMNASERNQITAGRNQVLGDQGDRRLTIQEQDAQTREDNAKSNREYTQARIKALGQGSYKLVPGDVGEPDHLMDTKSGKVIPLVDEQGAPINFSGPPEATQKQIEAAMARTKETIAGVDRRTDATIAGANQRNQASIDAAYERQSRTIEAGTGASGKRVAALENRDEQTTLRELSTKYPNVIKQTTSGKYFTVTPDEPGLWGEDLRPEFEKLNNELKTTLPVPKKSSPTIPSPKSVAPKTQGQTKVLKVKEDPTYGTVGFDGQGWFQVVKDRNGNWIEKQ